jgi:hypothetical protein
MLPNQTNMHCSTTAADVSKPNAAYFIKITLAAVILCQPPV